VIFLSGGQKLVFLRGEMHHKNLWLVDLETGAEQQIHIPIALYLRPIFPLIDHLLKVTRHRLVHC